MKNLFKINILVYLLLAGLLSTQVSCSATKRQQISAASDEAYNDFKNYVSNIDNEVSDEASDVADKWRETTATIESTYKEKENRLEQFADSWTDERQEEIAALKTRYKTFKEQREAEYQNRVVNNSQVSATSSNGGVAADFNTSGVENMAATNIRMAFENFINRIQANKDNYNHEDLQKINAYYEALDTRKDAVENQLTDNDKYEIAKAKTQYATFKVSALAAPHVKEAASDVKEATKTGAKKVGNAAEKVGSEVKSTTKKAVKKVDQKLDD